MTGPKTGPSAQHSNLVLRSAIGTYHHTKSLKKGTLAKFRAKLKMEDNPKRLTGILINDVQQRLSANQFGFDKMHPTTYLNGERWNDDIQTPVNQSVEDINSDLTWIQEMNL